MDGQDVELVRLNLSKQPSVEVGAVDSAAADDLVIGRQGGGDLRLRQFPARDDGAEDAIAAAIRIVCEGEGELFEEDQIGRASCRERVCSVV